MAKSSDIIKIGFDYRASLEQFVKETNGVFDGISEKAGKQRISIQLDAKNDKVIEKIKELQKLKLDKFTFEFGESGLAEQLKTFDQLEKKINEIINLSKGINNIGSGNGIGNSIVDEKSLNSIIDLFGKMENHLGEIKKVFTDVGDGGEFSPLLSTIDKINNSIKELSTSVKGIGLNMNIDVGSDTEMEAKVQSKISNALQAYQRLFDHIKMSSVGGSVINTNFFEFDINQYDTMMAKLQAYRKFIENMRNEAKAQFNGKDVLFQGTDKSYWSSASAAMGQVTKAFNEMNASADTSPLKNLFGEKTDLTEVVSQLNLIVDKLGEISTTASEFKNVFANGFNVSTSVEEIEKLTDRIKELEDELSKVKVSPTTSIKDTFQGDKIEQATTSAKELDKTLEQAVDVPTDKFDEILSKLDLTESKLGKIARITKQMHIDENGKPVESYTLKDKYGSTEIYGESSNKATKQLLSANYVEYDSKQAEKEAKELLAVEKEITKEIEKQEKAQASAQKKKWQSFQREQQKYDNEQKKTTNIERNKSAYQELLDTIKRYSEVSKRIAKNETLDGDLELAQKLEDKISELQKKPILSSSQVAKSERELVNLCDQLETLEKKTAQKQNNQANAQSAKEQAKAWEKNVKAIQEYMDANTKLNNLKAQDAGTGKKAKEIEYQTKEVERLEKVALEARAALSSMTNPHEAPIDDWNKWLEAMKQFDQATEGSARSVAKLEDALRNMAKSQSDKIKSVIESNQAHLDKLRPTEGNRSVEFENTVQEYNKAIIALRDFHATLDTSTPLTKEQSDEYEKLSNSLKEARVEMEKFSAAEKGSTEGSRWKEIDKITKYLEKNTRISKIAKQQLEDLVDTLKNVSGVNVEDIHLQFNKIAEAEREAGREGKRFIDILSDKALYGQAAQLAGYYLSLTDFIRYGKQAVDTIIELDTALIDLKKTTAMSGSEMENFYFEANDVAKEMGVTTQAIIEQSSAWSRLGYNTKEASTEMAKLSSKFATISPGMDTDTAQEGLVSIMKAWDIDVDQVESEVIDKINTLGNNFAEENQDIVEGMKRSAAALASTGTTYQDAFALFTGAQEVLQNSEVTGRALRSISMRIHGYSENSEDGLAELDEELTNITGDLIDLTKTAEHTQGVSIFKDGSTTEFKSLVDYFGEINAIWDEMSQKQQNDFLQMAFGKTQAQAGAALIQNYESVVGALEKMEQSAGSADAEMAAVESSLNYKINSLKETWVGTVQEMIDRGDLGVIIDGLVKLSEAIGFVLDKAGLLGTAGIIGGGILGVKNAGICV